MLQLFRLPDVFTAIADVTMGFLFVWPSLEPGRSISFRCCSHRCCYTRPGMVLNDVFDVELDRASGPNGRCRRGGSRSARRERLGFEMLLVAGGSSACLPRSRAGRRGPRESPFCLPR